MLTNEVITEQFESKKSGARAFPENLDNVEVALQENIVMWAELLYNLCKIYK